ncbi:MAG: hypothetical protein LBQ88_05650 [Treponema sp.]|jgi:hypothetical protein|nr:hypothetical protein [Treponema sp.]
MIYETFIEAQASSAGEGAGPPPDGRKPEFVDGNGMIHGGGAANLKEIENYE